jgi:8-oxo-dGTP pyrophosphatase MutT (NUDIX family)
MKTENKARRKTTSCGGLPWRLREGKLEVLLIKQFAHKDSWGIPKGHMHEGETAEQCALREVREEAGVEIVLGPRLPDVGTAFRDEDKTVVSWLGRPVGSEEPRHDDPDSEVADARWFNVDGLPPIHLYQRPLIAAAIDILSKTLERVEGRYMPMQPPEPKRG